MPIATILVEDSQTIRETLIPAMEELADLRVVATAQTPDEALQLLEEFKGRWTLIVVDLFLREGSGLAVVRACQTRDAQQRVVVLTNYATPDMRKRCAELGADRIFDKSTELEDFFSYCGDIES
jgi:DNA-binding NarL/FixJ family response regulator